MQISDTVKKMTTRELKAIIGSYHNSKDYDYFFEMVTIEYNNRQN